MPKYLIFVKAPINLHKTYYQNARRGQKCIRYQGTREDLYAKVAELKAQGETVLSACTVLGTDIKI